MADSKRRGADDEFDGDDDRTARGRDEFDSAELDAVDEDGDAGGSRRSGVKAAAGAKAVSRSKSTDGESKLFGRLFRFVSQVVAELQKVIWPTRKELLTYTTVVVVFVAVMMTFVALLDYGFAKAMILVFGGSANS